MNKFKELLFIQNIKGLGKISINKNNYLDIVEEYSDLDDLIAEIEYRFNIPLERLENSKKKTEEIYEYVINNPEITVITIFDDEYPGKLLDMGNEKPLMLYVKGNVEALSKQNLAVIGTRKPSDPSQVFEENLVRSVLKHNERVIVSGLALGCDKIAHQATVDENKITIAVLPSGVDVIKPARHKKLAQDIIDNGGCLVSEYEPNKSVFKGNYVERDKIVAAFSDATFVVECGVKSGTMHTVNAAKDYNRQIYAYLPDERPEGSYDGNEFILGNNESAIKVDNIEEFLGELETLTLKKKKKTVQQTLM